MGALTGHLPEIIIVLVVILIIWGPGKLPDVGAALGRGIREFRKASSAAEDAVVQATTATPAQPAPVAQVVAAPPAASQAHRAEPVAVPADATQHTPVSG